jgi:TonB-dependent SusC/RagA subfamily outer membrane receptor
MGIWVLQAVQCPSALIEAGYLSNNKDLAKMKDAGYQQKLAASILKGIENYLSNQERGVSTVVMDTIKKVMIVQGYKISPEDTLIAAKEKSKSVVIKMDGAGPSSNGQKPLFILDGEVISESVMSVIDPTKIESINILKDQAAVAVFGEKGKAGVVQITTKKGAAGEKLADGRIVIKGRVLEEPRKLEEKRIVISADTIVSHGGTVFLKSDNVATDAVELKGKTILLKSNNLKDVEFMAKNFDGAGNVKEEVKVVIMEKKGSSQNPPSLIFVDGEKKTKKEMQDRVDFCLDRVNLKGVHKLFPSECSGGMQKRIGIARAIAMNPKYLFCDEPNSGLDPLTSRVIDALLEDITKEFGITTIINSHDMKTVKEIGEHIVFMHQGEKWWEGSNKEIIEARKSNKELNEFFLASF